MWESVTFETKTWQRDYKLMLQTSHLERMIKNCNYQFENKQLIINNVDKPEYVKNKAVILIEQGIIDEVYMAADFSDKVLSEYDIDIESFKGGYYYSIAELVGIYCCKTKFLLHFSSDSYIPCQFNMTTWVKQAVDIMKNNPDIIVANPTWNYRYDEAKEESILQLDKFYLGQGFSDQCYLINTKIFKNKIYNYKHPDSERYPEYGGELFEKRVDAFMRTNHKYRLTAKNISYVSKNVRKKQYFLEKFGIKKI